MIDQTTGMWAAIGILAALLGRDRERRGWRDRRLAVRVRSSAWSPTTSWATSARGAIPRAGRGRPCFPLIAPYEAFATPVTASHDRGRERPAVRGMCEVSAAGDDRRPALRPPTRIGSGTATSCVGSWSRCSPRTTRRTGTHRSTEAGVPAAPVADVADVANAPQTEALGMIQHLDHPDDPRPAVDRRCRCRSTASVPCTRRRRRPSGSTPPRSSRELGYEPDEIAALAAEGVIRQ